MAVTDLWYTTDKRKTSLHGVGKRWQANFYANGRRYRKSFQTKAAAQAYEVEMLGGAQTGDLTVKERSRTVCSELIPKWLASLVHYRENTLTNVESEVAKHLTPKWGYMQVGAIQQPDLQAWVTELSASGLRPRSVDTIYGRMTNFLSWCVKSGYLLKSPAVDVNLPRHVRVEHIYLTPAQLSALVAAVPEHYRLAVELAGTTGLRAGELWELRAKDLRPRNRIRVSRSVTFPNGAPVVDAVKNSEARTIGVLPDLHTQLRERAKTMGPDDLLFTTPRGARQVNARNFLRRVFNTAVEAAGVPAGMRFHDLRHTAASLMISSGASVKAVQAQLGHKSATITLDIYADLFDDDLDALLVSLEKRMAS